MQSKLAQASRIIRKGGIVAFPTETVYGLGADATNPEAVARIFEIKARPRFDPLIVHVESAHAARGLAAQWPSDAQRLAERFWPGPLTLVLPRRAEAITDIVTAGLPTVALRVPDHPLALDLIRGAEVPIAAPSANRFGCISPTTAAHVWDSLGDSVDMVLDGGPCQAGVESTIIALGTEGPTLLRPGAAAIEEIESMIGVVGRPPRRLAPGAAAAAPGMLDRHYATTTPLYTFDEAPESLDRRRCGRLCFTAAAETSEYGALETLSRTGDLREAAAGLFAAMRRLDALGLDAIIADRFPEQGLGLAINDRLRRAACR